MGPLTNLFNYLVPASGNTSGYIVVNPLDTFVFDPSQIAAETGSPFIPSGAIIYNPGPSTAGFATLGISQVGLTFKVPDGKMLATPFPAPDGCRFTFTSFNATGAKVIFVDYPVLPFLCDI